MSIPYDPCHFDRDSDWRETRSKTMVLIESLKESREEIARRIENGEDEHEALLDFRQSNNLCIECGKRLKPGELETCFQCYMNFMMSEDYR